MNCPRCFGPLQANEHEDECDYHLCTDGNFQHRRHLAASREYDEIPMETPPLFLDDKKVEEWKVRVSGKATVREPGVCHFITPPLTWCDCYSHGVNDIHMV